jgi:hypothetical protein
MTRKEWALLKATGVLLLAEVAGSIYRISYSDMAETRLFPKKCWSYVPGVVKYATTNRQESSRGCVGILSGLWGVLNIITCASCPASKLNAGHICLFRPRSRASTPWAHPRPPVTYSLLLVTYYSLLLVLLRVFAFLPYRAVGERSSKGNRPSLHYRPDAPHRKALHR